MIRFIFVETVTSYRESRECALLADVLTDVRLVEDDNVHRVGGTALRCTLGRHAKALHVEIKLTLLPVPREDIKWKNHQHPAQWQTSSQTDKLTDWPVHKQMSSQTEQFTNG